MNTVFQGKSMLHRTTKHRLLLGALPLLLASTAHAQTTLTPPAAADGTVAVIPAGPKRQALKVVVAAVVDTSGNAENAKAGLKYATQALQLTPGYDPKAGSEYAPLSEALAKDATNVDWGYPFTASDFQKIGKAGAADRILTLEITPSGAFYTAQAELYDASRGALVQVGKANGDSLERAILSAIIKLGDTASFTGIVISKPSGYNARVSTGTLAGARAGARVEYLNEAGEAFAYGTLFDVAAGEGVATVAPEAAYPQVYVNTRVRIVNNPVEKRALPDSGTKFEKEMDKAEKSFALAAAIATAVYYLAIAD